MMSPANEMASTCGSVLLETSGMAYFCKANKRYVFTKNSLIFLFTIAADIATNATAQTTASFWA